MLYKLLNIIINIITHILLYDALPLSYSHIAVRCPASVVLTYCCTMPCLCRTHILLYDALPLSYSHIAVRCPASVVLTYCCMMPCLCRGVSVYVDTSDTSVPDKALIVSNSLMKPAPSSRGCSSKCVSSLCSPDRFTIALSKQRTH